jgi:nitroreductase
MNITEADASTPWRYVAAVGRAATHDGRHISSLAAVAAFRETRNRAGPAACRVAGVFATDGSESSAVYADAGQAQGRRRRVGMEHRSALRYTEYAIYNSERG